MWRAHARRRRISALAAVLWLAAQTAAAATRFDPGLTFRRLSTPHFVIYFHQGEDGLATRLSGIAEETWRALEAPLGHPPPSLTHVVIADQAELANGWATPLPFDTIVLTAAAPAGSEFIGNADDWLRVVFTHEFTHIVHLSRSRGFARLVRGVFGRVPLAFPNLFLPAWEIEGLATYYESALTGEGRLHAGDFRAVEREAARGGAAFPMDRAGGGLIRWPGGTAAYAYGLGFHAYLADRFGEDRFGELAERSAGRVPYTASRVFTGIYGAPLGTLWKDYQASLAMTPRADPDESMATPLTRDGFVAIGPRVTASCAECPAEVVYSVRTPDGFPSLQIVPLARGAPRALTTRYLGSTVGVSNEILVFDQQDLRRNVGLYSDLYVLDRRTGRVQRLTTEARLLDPDLSPDGQRVVAVRERRGARELVTAALRRSTGGGTTSPSWTLAPVEVIRGTDDGDRPVQFSAPRWSPDGRRIAVERRRTGEASAIVVVDPDTGDVRVVGTGATRAVTPAWRPDGRGLVAAVDRPDGPFDLVEFAFEPDGRIVRRALTHTSGGAIWPDVSPDGRTLVYVRYGPRGYDVYAQPYTPLDVIPPPAAASPRRAAVAAVAQLPDSGRVSGYAPWATLTPRAWAPVIFGDGDQVQAGVSTGGSDVLGYHGWSGSASWRVSGPAGADGSRGTPDWTAFYEYDRYRPAPFVSASRATSYLTGASAPHGGVAALAERTVEAGVFVPVRRVRRAQRVLVSALRSDSTLTDARSETSVGRIGARAGWSASTAREYGASISPEDGITVGLTAEVAGRDMGDVGAARTVTADLRGYLRGLGRHHVVAVRAAGGRSTGPAGLGRTFRLGGAAPAIDVLDQGRGALSLLRGFPPDTFAGRRIATTSVDYRFPLLRVERGVGTWPIFLQTIHAAVFADAAEAWTVRFDRRSMASAAGVEVSADVVAGYGLPLSLTVGVGRGRDGAGRAAPATTAYVRIGRAF